MTRRSVRVRFALAVPVIVVALAACTGSGDEPTALPFEEEDAVTETVETTETAEPVDLQPIEDLWLAAGADADLAACYRDVLDDAGLTGQIESLADVVTIQEQLTDEQRAAFDECTELVN